MEPRDIENPIAEADFKNQNIKKISFTTTITESKTVEHFVESGVYYFSKSNEDGEKYLYKRIEIVKDTRFLNLFDMEVQTVKYYGDDLFVSVRKVTECDLPWEENIYFRNDDVLIQESDEATFYRMKSEVLSKLTLNN